ncbi:hypothetical protein Tco_0025182 [Tanacetum coccineum]
MPSSLTSILKLRAWVSTLGQFQYGKQHHKASGCNLFLVIQMMIVAENWIPPVTGLWAGVRNIVMDWGVYLDTGRWENILLFPVGGWPKEGLFKHQSSQSYSEKDIHHFIHGYRVKLVLLDCFSCLYYEYHEQSTYASEGTSRSNSQNLPSENRLWQVLQQFAFWFPDLFFFIQDSSNGGGSIHRVQDINNTHSMICRWESFTPVRGKHRDISLLESLLEISGDKLRQEYWVDTLINAEFGFGAKVQPFHVVLLWTQKSVLGQISLGSKDRGCMIGSGRYMTIIQRRPGLLCTSRDIRVFVAFCYLVLSS